MQDWHSSRLKRQDRKTLGLLRKAVPGEFQPVTDVAHPAFDAIVLDMEEATLPPPCPGAIAKLWEAENVPVRTAPFNQAVSSPGDWVVFTDPEMGDASLTSLWLCVFCDNVTDLVKALTRECLKDGKILIKCHRDGFLVAFDGFTLKSFVKNYTTEE